MITLAPLYHRQPVIVHDSVTPWAAQVAQIGLWPSSPVMVVCTDPLDRPDRWRGQYVVVLPTVLESAPRRRWF